MPQSVSELRPYKSLMLGRVRHGVPLSPLVNDVLDDVVRFVRGGPNYALQRREAPEPRASWSLGSSTTSRTAR
jgi:hypothetical protein